MRGRDIPIIVEDCLQRLDRGESLPDLLADFPAQADQLKPLLLVAMASRAFPVPVPSQTAQRLGRNQMLAEMNRLEIKKAFRKKPAIPPTSRWIGALVRAARSGGFTRLSYSYRLAMVSLVLILSGGFFTLNASASSQPGDLLYNLRLGMERAGLTLTVADQDPTNGSNQLHQISPEPWQFGQSDWALHQIYGGYQDLEIDSFDFFPPNESMPFSADPADPDLAGEKHLKEESKEAAEEEREAAKDLKEDQKAEAEAEREAAMDLKEDQKAEAEAEREAAKDLKEEQKEAAQVIREAKKVEKEADKIEKERVKDAKKDQ